MKVPITWTGEDPTMIRVEENGEKMEMKKGETLECEIEIARSYAKNDKRFDLHGVPLEMDEKGLKKHIKELEDEIVKLKAQVVELGGALEDPKPKNEKKDKKGEDPKPKNEK